jgi:hypothetical protein
MDFGKILHDNLASSTKPERAAFYETLRARLRATLDKNGLDTTSEVAVRYFDSLEDAIESHERIATFSELSPKDPSQVAAVEVTSNQTSELPYPAPSKRAEPPLMSAPREHRQDTGTSRTWIGMVFIFLGGILLGYFATQFSASGNADIGANHTARVANETARYEGNIAYLKAVDAAIRQYHQRSGRYPESDSFAAIAGLAKGLPNLILPSAPQGGNADRLYYKSNGRDFKLMFNRSGDCFVARLKNPELIDSSRASGPVDCQDYGTWSPGGKEF